MDTNNWLHTIQSSIALSDAVYGLLYYGQLFIRPGVALASAEGTVVVI